MQEDKKGKNEVLDVLSAESTDNAASIEKIDKLAQNEKFLEQLKQAHKKLVAVGQVSDQFKAQFLALNQEMKELCDEAQVKKEEVLRKSNEIKDRVEALLHSAKVHIDQDEYKKSAASVAQYAALLDGICAELEGERAYFTLLAGEKCPKHVLAQENASDLFEIVADEKIKFIKRHIKNIKRDLQVSYSRYCYGFDAQIKRIDYVEAMVKNAGKSGS